MIKYLILAFLIFSCSTTPTGRNQLKLMPESQMDALGNQSYQQMRKKIPISNNRRYNNYVRCVSHAILKANGRNINNWKITVFKDPTANAFALPGKNIGVHTGLLKIATNQEELAAVIGHEIAHVDAHHGNERVSLNMVVQLGLAAGQIALSSGKNKTKNDLILLGALGLSQFGILLPFSRSHETEADLLGLKYMANAGFDPTKASNLWVKMSKGKSSLPEFASTHPNSQTRIKALNREAIKYVTTYQNVTHKPRCSL